MGWTLLKCVQMNGIDIVVTAPILVAILLGFVSGLVAKAVYSLIRSDWPESYVYTKPLLERLGNRNIAAYLFLRFIPLFLTLFLGTATASQLGVSLLICCVTATILFLLLTDVWALITMHRYGDSRKGTLTVFYIGNMLITVIVGICAYFSSKVAWFLAPSIEELVNAFWTAAAIAVLAFGLKRLLSAPSMTTEQKINTARKDMGEYAWSQSEEIADAYGIDVNIIRAIIITEVLQRPHWFRVLERFFGKFLKSATYGVAQAISDKPVSDTESIGLLCREMQQHMEFVVSDTESIPFGRYESFVGARGATTGYVDEVRQVFYGLVQ